MSDNPIRDYIESLPSFEYGGFTFRDHPEVCGCGSCPILKREGRIVTLHFWDQDKHFYQVWGGPAYVTREQAAEALIRKCSVQFPHV